MKTFYKFILLYCFLLAQTNAIAQTPDTLWHEDWEGNWSNDWHTSAGTWEVGTPTSGPNSAYTGQQCAATVLNGNYSEPVDSRLIRHIPFDVPSATQNPRLRFWHWYSFSSGDFGEVHISTDNGISWDTLAVRYENTSSGVWTRPMLDISQYSNSTIILSFYFHSHRVGSYSNVSSGWYFDDLMLITGPLDFDNPVDFEDGLGRWSVDKGTWEVGAPQSGPGNAHSGQFCAATVLDGNYAEPVDSRIISVPFPVPLASELPRLRYWHWYSFSTGDFGEVHVSSDGGSSWDTLSVRYTNTGSGVWTCPSLDLTEYSGMNIQVAFYFHSHRVGSYSNVGKGWYIDDIQIVTGPLVMENPENFENGMQDWWIEKGTWEIGSPTAGPDSSYSIPNCAGTVMGGNYAEPVDSRLISPPFLVDTQNPALRFWHWYNFASGDYGEVQLKTENSAWQAISPQFTNTSSGVWTNYYIPLSAFADSTVQLAFFFHSHRVGSYTNVSKGWFVDNIAVDWNVNIGGGIENNIQSSFNLHQNYPNPFNPVTQIKYSIPKTSNIKIEVFDLLGQKVADLVNRQMPAGEHQVQFNGTNLSSGVYLYKIEAGEFTQTRKMVLMK